MVSGRELVAPHLPIHGRGTWLVKAVLLHPAVRKVLGLWRLWCGAAVLLFLAEKARKRRQQQQPFAKALPASVPAPGAAVPRQRPRFVELLRPRAGGFFSAGPEISTLVVASGLNAWLMLYKAWLMREFVIGQNLGHWRRWLKALAKFPFAILASALLSQTTKYMQARVGILWRRTATRRLLQSYFSDMNYYKLSQHGSARIEDPDIRICSDVRSGCEALTGVLISGLSGVTMSLFSSWALYRRRGLFAVFLPYLYSFFIVPLSYRLTSPDWSVAMQVYKADGAYQQALTRVQQAGESVAMLKGEDFEKDVLDYAAGQRAAAERRSWATMACFEWFQHYISNPAMPGMWQSIASFGAAFIAMRAYGPGRPVLDPRVPNEAVVLEYGANISDFWQVFYAVRGAVTFMMAMETYKRSQQNLFRVEELQAAFSTLASEEAEAATFNEGPAIAFEDVSIVTPTGIPLLAGLTFKVEPGRHLVICGHNGAGKSSIFRCLGGLWPVAKGTITCPSAFARGLHGDVYYLPQRPVNILGTLSDQLTYPTRVSGGLPVEELRRWLGYVGMADFVDAAVGGRVAVLPAVVERAAAFGNRTGPLPSPPLRHPRRVHVGGLQGPRALAVPRPMAFLYDKGEGVRERIAGGSLAWIAHLIHSATKYENGKARLLFAADLMKYLVQSMLALRISGVYDADDKYSSAQTIDECVRRVSMASQERMILNYEFALFLCVLVLPF
ncbi:ABCD1 [Symbiodinium natans]|uniref:ABCD1 protein n=1 Tax=Symbiodinium natans TaxID=878477 RepID=A0A812GR19_9DINO|nr:ABCD1 [Symbiodinium natans]